MYTSRLSLLFFTMLCSMPGAPTRNCLRIFGERRGTTSEGAGRWICYSARSEAMNESEWLASTDPTPMLAVPAGQGE